jgi:hypothetical protein
MKNWDAKRLRCVCVCICFCVTSSLQLFRGVLKWGKVQLPRGSVDRKQLKCTVKELLGHIRFPHMSVKERLEAVKSGYVWGIALIDSLVDKLSRLPALFHLH